MAEKRGFEPLRPVTDLLAFQASPFSLLGTSPFLAGPERFELSVSESESDALTTWPWPNKLCKYNYNFIYKICKQINSEMVRLMGFEPTHQL